MITNATWWINKSVPFFVDHLALEVDEALEILVKRADEIEANIGLIDDFVILKGFLVAQRVGGKNAAQAITTLRILPDTLVQAGFSTRAQFVEAISLLPIKDLESRLSVGEFAALQNKMESIFKSLGKVNPPDANAETVAALDRIASGAMGQFLGSLERMLKGNVDEFTKAFEVDYSVHQRVGSGILGTHRADELLASGKLIESKLWSAGYLRVGFRRAFSKTVSESAEDPDKPGQLLLDIVDFARSGEFSFRWEMGGDLARQGITERDLANMVMELVKESDEVRGSLQKALVMTHGSLEWDRFLERLAPALENDLFQIVDYQEIFSRLGT